MSLEPIKPIKLDLSFDALTRLFKEHDVNLKRCGTTVDFPNCCPVAAIAVINNTTYMSIDGKLDDKTSIRLASIEAGFEGWPVDEEHIGVYYKIGQKLYNASRKGA